MKEEMRVQRRVLLQDWGFSGGCSTMRLFPLSFSISSECTLKCLSACQHLLLVLKESRACEKPVVDSDEILRRMFGYRYRQKGSIRTSVPRNIQHTVSRRSPQHSGFLFAFGIHLNQFLVRRQR